MKEQIEIYNKIRVLKEQLMEIENEIYGLQQECEHKLVLAFDDCMPYKVMGKFIFRT